MQVEINVAITLLDKSGNKAKELIVPAASIEEAAMIVHEGKYYAFKGMQGRFFTGVAFIECKPPVEV